MEKPFVFVLMPFAKEFDNVYESGIKSAANDVGMYCERVDTQIFEERILDRIYNQINKADYIIADLSGKNPNVFYETGYAHALNKKVILVNSSAKDMPFDLTHHPQIIYNGDIKNLKEELIRRLKWFSENPTRVTSPNFDFLKFVISGQYINNNTTINIIRTYSYKTINDINLVLNINNTSNSIFSENIEVALQTFGSDFKREPKDKASIKIPNSGLFYPGGQIPKLLPNSWASLDFVLKTKLNENKTYQMELRIFTELQTIIIPFNLNIKVTDIPPLPSVSFGGSA